MQAFNTLTYLAGPDVHCSPKWNGRERADVIKIRGHNNEEWYGKTILLFKIYRDGVLVREAFLIYPF